MNFAIRAATGADSEAAAGVVQKVFEEYGFTWDPHDYSADLYDLESHYLAEGHAFWIAELVSPLQNLPAGTVVGTCALETFDRLPGLAGEPVLHDGVVRAGGADCSLERLYTLPEARGLGLGTALLKMAVEEGLRRSCTVMEIWSDKKLTLAHRLYEKYGALRIGDRICDDPDESPEWGMALVLSEDLVKRLPGSGHVKSSVG